VLRIGLALLCALFVSSGMAQPLYSTGELPVGSYYTEDELEGLAGKQLPVNCYLIGRFVFIEEMKAASIFVFAPYDYAQEGIIDQVLIVVKFFGAPPDNLTIGKEIVATRQNPLSIQYVRSENGVIVAMAESWSK